MCIKTKSEMFCLGIVILSFAIAVYLYPMMPDRVASHWNAQGQVDGYTDKFWGLFIMPLVSIALLLLFVAIPRIDPLKENIQKFRKTFDIFVILVLLFLLYLFSLTIIWNFGTKFNMIWALVPAFVGLFYYVGILVENAKRNWFIGIRTPWTIMNENVWNRTHKLGGKLFKISALIAVLGMLFEDYALWFVLVPIIAVSAYLFVYSYFEFQKEMMKKPKKKKK
jgi:uncharacterized membrane protein